MPRLALRPCRQLGNGRHLARCGEAAVADVQYDSCRLYALHSDQYDGEGEGQ